MKRNDAIRIKARRLRASGQSLNEICNNLNLPKSTIQYWLRNIKLSETAKERIVQLKITGAARGARARSNMARKARSMLADDVKKEIGNLKSSKDLDKIILAMLYWCEGAKAGSYISFTNSDPAMSRFFIELLVDYLNVDRSQIKVKLHLHEYHDKLKMIRYWARELRLDARQFKAPYLKPHTGKNRKEGYPGCANIRYYSGFFANKLLYLAKEYLNHRVGA